MAEESTTSCEDAESSIRTRDLSSNPIGIDSAPHQLVKKRMQEGFILNILLIGETGIGKTTLACSLFNLPPDASTESHKNSDVTLQSHAYDLREKGVNLKLTIAETVGYGDQIDRRDSVEPITKYIEDQLEKCFQEELKENRSLSTYRDTRIHACLYFVCPTGHSLKSVDVFCMEQLHDKVNLIPIVARADSLSKEELQLFKSKIKSDIEEHGIKTYNFPTEDEEILDSNSKSNELMPFAVAASEDYVYARNKLRRAREFPWGTMFVENEEHTELLALRRALVEMNMEDMIEKTSQYYEKYRSMRLTELFNSEPGSNESISFHEYVQKQREKLRQEMLEKERKLEEKFIQKMKAKEAEFKVREDTLRSRYKKIFDQMKTEEESVLLEKHRLDLEILNFRKKKEKKIKK